MIDLQLFTKQLFFFIDGVICFDIKCLYSYIGWVMGYKILSKKELCPNQFELTIEAPYITKNANMR